MSIRSGHHQWRPLFVVGREAQLPLLPTFRETSEFRDPVAATAWLAANPQKMYR